ncbi:MAG: hypothetical protein ICV66_13080 [Chitinophagaceae bacterium]|nr:hypothetical protein [Chitinophagaceae bacterium]
MRHISIYEKNLFILLNNVDMKNIRNTLIGFAFVFMVSSCSVVNNLFPSKYGCKSNGKNVGAEKVLEGNAPKAKRFKA